MKNQLDMLEAAASDFFQKGRMCVKAADAEKFTTLALSCLAEFQKIKATMANNSAMLFFECCTELDKRGNYRAYLDFCARNGLEILSQDDFEAFSDSIYPTKPLTD
jgi:hypothetical protein